MMKAGLGQLTKGLEQVVSLLDQDSLLPLSAEHRAGYLAAAERLLGRLRDAAEQVLTIGLLGGTGVGKSTLMNRLAGADIASTSHRRPHTDKVLIYRHETATLPAELEANPVARIEHHHRIDAVAGIVLCDLPDFDSLLGEHRTRVLQFLSELDLLVWVSSPEKYADQKFYEFLELVPKARKNFTFVLNKADLLLVGQPTEAGYARIEALIAQFRSHLGNAGIDQPVIFPVSAEQVRSGGQPAPWNQFPAFREMVLRHRDFKEITAIKTANLDIEARRLIRDLRRELRSLEDLGQVLSELRQDLDTQLDQCRQEGRQAIADWLSRDLTDRLIDRIEDPSALIGAGRGLLAISRHWRLKQEQRSRPGDALEILEPKPVTAAFSRRWQRLRTKVELLLLRREVPEPAALSLHRVLDQGAAAELLGDRMTQAATARARDLRPLPRPGFRALQLMSNALLGAIFLLALGGPETWRQALDSPTVANFTGLFGALLSGLFSPRGLAALAVLALLHLLLALRFHRRHKNFLRRRAQKIIQSIEAELAALWDQAWEAPAAELARLSAELEQRLAQASALGEHEKGT
ncbi:MAG: hypothetical protein COT06_07295 [Syntrophobacteraceae bacterium CG07_land_8_20_14_0_80_61_8]|nr:MAG: hypothetical protein COT06_07295 [Syntrophobacteraceae bacterium CG07_land_8_20_14_0_80_61_8]